MWRPMLCGRCRYCGTNQYRHKMWLHTQTKTCRAYARHFELKMLGWKPVWKMNMLLLQRFGIERTWATTASHDPEMRVGVIAIRERLWCPGWVADIIYDATEAWHETFAGLQRKRFLSRKDMIVVLERNLRDRSLR